MSTRIPPDERRRQLLQVAEHIFATRPYSKVSIQEIADEAGVTRGLVHHYFGGKDEVMAAVMKEMIPDKGPPPLDTDLPLRERVETRVDLLMATLEHHSEGWLATLAMGPNLEGPLLEAAEELWDIQYRVWLGTFADVLTDNDRTRSLYDSYRGLNQATCRLWLSGTLTRDDARLILVTAQTALIEGVGPQFA